MSQLMTLLNQFESCTPQAQCSTLRAITQVIDVLDEQTITKTVLPKLRMVFDATLDIEVQEHALLCLQRLIDYLPKNEILDEVLPMLAKARLFEPSVLMLVARIYKHMLADKARYGLTINVLATRVMPTLIPVVVSEDLDDDEFAFVSELLQEMLDQVTAGQRIKLKMEKVDSPSFEKKMLIPLQITIDAPSPTCPFPDDFNNSSFLMSGESRRQSVSSESIAKLMRAVSPESSDDEDVDDASNFLKVMEKGLNQRRHSDTPLQVPRKFSVSATPSPVASRSPSPSLITRARSSSNLINSSHRRRHSSVNPHDIQRFASKLMDSAAESMVESVEKASKATSGMHLGLETISGVSGLGSNLPSPGGRRGSRRCSVVDILAAAQSPSSCLAAHTSKSKSKSPSKKLFKKLGSEMNNLLKK